MDDSSSLEREVKLLKRELRASKMENEDLMDEEVTDLQHELDFCHRILSFRKLFSQPPPEILQLVFERIIPPAFLVNSSASFVPNSLWCEVQQQKNSIVNVCRTWYTIGLPFLYADITIRRVYQLSNLLRTLRFSSPNLNLKEMIKTLEFHCFVPAWYRQQFEQQLKVLFDICPRIMSCSFGSQMSPFPLPSASPLCAMVPKITQLRLYYNIDMQMLKNILKLASPHLLSLSFSIPSIYKNSDVPTRCSFPHLEDLSIRLLIGSSPEEFIGVWEMPRLRRMTVLGCLPLKTLKHFCDAYGSGLQYLHFASERVMSIRNIRKFNSETVPDLLNSCPVLKHIVLSPNFSGLLTHKSIEWIDIWASDENFRAVRMWRKDVMRRTAELPALKGVRILPYQFDELPVNLPFLLPPTLVSTPAEGFAFQFSNVIIQHEVGELRYRQPDWAADNSDAAEDADGSIFLPDASDADDESDFSDRSSEWEATSDDEIIPEWDAEMDTL